MFAQIAQRNVVEGDERSARMREQYLPARGCCQQPRDAIDDGAEIIAVAFIRPSAMQRHAHCQSADRAPILCPKRALRVGSRCDRIRCAGKCHAECIAYRLKHPTTVRFDRGAQQLVMASESSRHLVRPLFPALRAAFDVGKEQRHGSARKRGS